MDHPTTPREAKALRLFLAFADLAADTLRDGLPALACADPCLNVPADLAADAAALEYSTRFFGNLLAPLADAEGAAVPLDPVALAPACPAFDPMVWPTCVLAERAQRRHAMYWPIRLAIAWLECALLALNAGAVSLPALVARQSLLALGTQMLAPLEFEDVPLDEAEAFISRFLSEAPAAA